MNDFTKILGQYGINKQYTETLIELENQSKLPATLSAAQAFEKGIQALFIDNPGTDNFYNMISNDADSYGLQTAPTSEKIKQVIVDLINQDQAFSIVLLPLAIDGNSEIPFRVFPPENGESGNEFWIWFVKVSFFPGPYWILVDRQDMKSYSYGYL